ncbi:hypothetical protein [Pontibacter amylolyticus]|uniref:Lipoprotein n=1 Tax=Pontibacter amylolyticus TaxID=1424080 RepID=A0ABQ1WGF0_9BACT|nr:hypothetical protein [Pontibacter amylolyticus]GGG28585.1 hypothetical protein GCM10011323_34960 [Pontibacter amylolyticus]
MKNLPFVVFVCLLLSCSKEDLGTVNAYLGQEIKLKEGQAALYKNTGFDAAAIVKLKVADVSDGRCPSDVFCITYGSVEVTLTIGMANEKGETITMCQGDCDGGSRFEDEARVVVGGMPYKIRLLAVMPLPSLKDESSKTKEIQLVLERG